MVRTLPEQILKSFLHFIKRFVGFLQEICDFVSKISGLGWWKEFVYKLRHKIFPSQNRSRRMYECGSDFVKETKMVVWILSSHPDFLNHVYRLKKALYGLKQAPRAWKHEMEKCDTVTTIMAIAKIDTDLQGTPTNQTKYHSMILELMYLTASRPDIAFATSDSGFKLIMYSNADLAGCLDDYKSTSGGLQFLGDKLVSWSSKKQDYTAMSTVEAKYVSLSACCAQVIWMRTQLLDYGYRYNKIPMYFFHMAQQTILAAQLVPKFQGIRRCNNYVVLQNNPFVTPVNIEIIKSCMRMVGYQGVVDKLRPILEVLHISPRLEENCHFIKDDILLVSVYTTRNVQVQGMLIPNAFLTEEIRATDDHKEYEIVFVNVVVPMNEPQPIISTQGTHKLAPKAHRIPTLTAASH
nr:hypothetical protein [Tanacetum cinerariifolium]